jgi:7-cyano-7-deazaguanine synthase
MADQKGSVVVISGGLDSTTLLHYVVKRLRLNDQPIFALTFDYGQTLVREIECAKYQCELLGVPHQVIDLKHLAQQLFSTSALLQGTSIPDVEAVMGDPQPVTYVPNRNTLFVEIATAFAENNNCDTVYIGIQRHDLYGYWDTTPQWAKAINGVHALNRKNQVWVSAPFVNYTKAAELELGIKLGVDYSRTWSCYKGGGKACGVCATCAERIAAFKAIEVVDPVPYEIEIDWSTK